MANSCGFIPVLALMLTVVIIHATLTPPDLQMDQPAVAQPDPSFKAKDYAARALEILTTRSQKKKPYLYLSRYLRDSECPDKYTKLSQSHTMCLKDIGKGVRLSQAQKDAIVKHHNVYRSSVSPPASNMQKMVWDESLAEIAGKWSRQCHAGHDASPDRASPDLPGIWIGQNAAFGQQNWKEAIDAWHSEITDFKYGIGAIGGGIVGHYTQLVTARSSRVGCGEAYCPETKYKKFYFCNYAVGQMDSKTPYKKGPVCAECPYKCNKAINMCDCGGKICFHGGKMDLNNCKCKCPHNFAGDQCQTVHCPAKDKSFCGTQWPKSYCKKYTNVPQDCPHMCDVCP